MEWNEVHQYSENDSRFEWNQFIGCDSDMLEVGQASPGTLVDQLHPPSHFTDHIHLY